MGWGGGGHASCRHPTPSRIGGGRGGARYDTGHNHAHPRPVATQHRRIVFPCHGPKTAPTWRSGRIAGKTPLPTRCRGNRSSRGQRQRPVEATCHPLGNPHTKRACKRAAGIVYLGTEDHVANAAVANASAEGTYGAANTPASRAPKEGDLERGRKRARRCGRALNARHSERLKRLQTHSKRGVRRLCLQGRHTQTRWRARQKHGVCHPS